MYDLALDAFRVPRRRADVPAPERVVARRVLQPRPLRRRRRARAAGRLDVGRHDRRRGQRTDRGASSLRARCRGVDHPPGAVRLVQRRRHRRRSEAPTRSRSTTPQSLDALDRFLALRADGLIPTLEESAAEDDEARFANGRLAMYLNSRRVTPQFRLIDDFEWDVAPLPVLGAPAGVLHSDAYCLTKDSEHHDAAFAFLEYALGPTGAPGHRPHRAHRAVAAIGRRVRRLPRSRRRRRPRRRCSSTPSRPSASCRRSRRGRRSRTSPTRSSARRGEAGTPAAEVARQLDDATRDLFARAE